MEANIETRSIPAIIRTSDGTPLTPQQLRTVRALAHLPDDTRLSATYVSAYDPQALRKSYLDRIKATHAAALHVIKLHRPNYGYTEFSVLERFDALEKSIQLLFDHHQQIISTLEKIKPLQDAFTNLLIEAQQTMMRGLYIDEDEAKKLLAIAEEYTLISGQPKPILVTVTPFNHDLLLVQIEQPQAPLSDAQLDELLRTKEKNKPEWYQLMPKREKRFFDAMMQTIHTREELRKKLHALSSKHRTIPGVANFLKHETAIIGKDGKIVYQSPARYRSSMVSSRDLQKYKGDRTELRVNTTISNIHQIIQTAVDDIFSDPARRNAYRHPDGTVNLDEIAKLPILLQTLISPSAVASLAMPDHDLYLDKIKAIESIKKQGIRITIDGQPTTIQFSNIISTNHPLNKLGRLLIGMDGKADAVKLIALAKENLRPANPGYAAAEELEKLIKVGLFENLTDDNQLQLHMAALEELIVTRLGGVSYGSCVSGKDRKGLETLYADAMELYLLSYGKLPRYDDHLHSKEDRQNFVELFAHLFVSRHQQTSAGLNAHGADGIKTPDLYLPQDIQQAINKLNPTLLKESDRLASNNELNKLLDKGKHSPHLSMKRHTAHPDDQPFSFLQLKQLIQSTRWKEVESGNIPAYILEMRRIVDNKRHESEETVKSRLAAYCEHYLASQSGSSEPPASPFVLDTLFYLRGNPASLPNLKTNHVALYQRPRELISIIMEITQRDVWDVSSNKLFGRKTPEGIQAIRQLVIEYADKIETDPYGVLAKITDICKQRTLSLTSSASGIFRNEATSNLYQAIIKASEQLYAPHDITQALNAILLPLQTSTEETSLGKSPRIKRLE